MSDAHKNFPYSTVATAPSPATTGVSLVLAAGGGALMPTVPFNMPIWPTGVQPLASNAEVVRVTNIATDTLTIVRQQEGSSARTIVIGDQVGALITNKTLTDMDGQRAPTDDMLIQANCSQVIPRKLLIASGKKFVIGSGAALRIL
jgi:hypothetical protein